MIPTLFQTLLLQKQTVQLLKQENHNKICYRDRVIKFEYYGLPLKPISPYFAGSKWKKFSSVIYCFQKCKQKEIFFWWKNKIVNADKSKVIKCFFLRPSRVIKLIAVWKETSQWQRTFFKKSHNSRGLEDFPIYQSQFWSLIFEESWENRTNRLLIDAQDLKRLAV